VPSPMRGTAARGAFGDWMKAAIVDEARELRVLEVADPVPGPFECLVRIDDQLRM